MTTRQTVRKTALLERSQAITAGELFKLKKRKKAGVLLLTVGVMLTQIGNNAGIALLLTGAMTLAAVAAIKRRGPSVRPLLNRPARPWKITDFNDGEA